MVTKMISPFYCLQGRYLMIIGRWIPLDQAVIHPLNLRVDSGFGKGLDDLIEQFLLLEALLILEDGLVGGLEDFHAFLEFSPLDEDAA